MSPSLQKWQSFHVISLSASFPGYFPGGQVSEQAPTSWFFASVEPSEGCSYRNELRKAGRTSWPSPSSIMKSWENGCLFYRRRTVLPWKTESFPEHALPDCQTLTQGYCVTTLACRWLPQSNIIPILSVEMCLNSIQHNTTVPLSAKRVCPHFHLHFNISLLYMNGCFTDFSFKPLTASVCSLN